MGNTGKFRKVEQLIGARTMEEGEGFIVNRPLPALGLRQMDPFLLLDELGPYVVGPGQAKGAPSHPHRGFETVTYLLAGEWEHHDSVGNQGLLRPGDVQWMTAGGGVIHSEMPTERFKRSGGPMHGFQVWVNLPKRDKMMNPRYQEIPSASIPEAVVKDSSRRQIRAKIIAGRFADVSAKIDTRTPIEFMDFTLEPGATLEHETPEGFSAFFYVFEGEGIFGEDERSAPRGTLVQFENTSGGVVARNGGSKPLRFLYLAGKPIGEPIAHFGPFVMNTQEELEEAFWDFQTGNFIRKTL